MEELITVVEIRKHADGSTSAGSLLELTRSEAEKAVKEERVRVLGWSTGVIPWEVETSITEKVEENGTY